MRVVFRVGDQVHRHVRDERWGIVPFDFNRVGFGMGGEVVNGDLIPPGLRPSISRGGRQGGAGR